MKKMKRIGAALLMLVMLSAILFTGCGEKQTVSGDAVYTVKVVTADGQPCTENVIVKFMQNGEQAAMLPVNANGSVEKTLTRGDYSVELIFTDDTVAYQYDKETAVLSADKTEVEIKLTKGLSNKTTVLYVDGEEYAAYSADVGSTNVTVTENIRNYFLFVPREAGVYQFSVDNQELKLGYYGGNTNFIFPESAVEVVDNTFSTSISASMIGSEGGTGTTVVILGIDGVAEKKDCVLTITRTGDPEMTVSDYPWTEYKTTHEVKPYTLEMTEGQQLVYMDIMSETAKHTFVYNETDGYYHLDTAEGPVIHVHLAKGAPYVSLQVMIQGDGPMGGAPIRNYFYDEEGNFVKKEDYTDIMVEYFENMDQKQGVYPLTDDLIYIIKNACSGWWNSESPDYIFTDCNPELGWMFACCWVA